MRKKHSRCKNISWRKEERKAKEKTSLFPKEEDSLENKQARQRISPPRSANDLLASLAGWRVGNSRFSRGRKRIVDGTVRSLIPSESREELLAASYLLRSIELLLHLLLLLSRPPPSSFHFCSFSSRFSPRSISSFSTLTPPRVGRSVGAVLVFKDLITDLLAHSVLWNATLVSIFSSFSTFFLSSLASHALSSSSFSSSSSSSRLGLLLTKVCGHPPFPRKRNERQRGKEA